MSELTDLCGRACFFVKISSGKQKVRKSNQSYKKETATNQRRNSMSRSTPETDDDAKRNNNDYNNDYNKLARH